MAFYGATEGHFTGMSFATSTQRSLLKLKYSLATYDIQRPLSEVINGLNDFQPDILMGYASSLAMLAQRQASGELKISPRWVQSSGEVLTEADWELIESTFGVPLFNVYSCSEHLIMGYGTRQFGGTYLFEDDLIFELDTEHTLVTNLFNYTLPLVRYRMDDILERQENGQQIYPYTKIKNIAGRRENIPYFINNRGEEDFISPHVITEFHVRNVCRYQFEAVDKAKCIFRVCLEKGLSAQGEEETIREVQARLGQIFEKKGMTNVSRRVEVVDELLPDPKTGKFRVILV